MNELNKHFVGKVLIQKGTPTNERRASPRYSWYLSFFDGHAQLLIGPCGYDCKEWRELGPVDEKELQRDDSGTWQKAILKYKVNAYDYRCNVASLPFMGDLPLDYLIRKLKQKGIL